MLLPGRVGKQFFKSFILSQNHLIINFIFQDSGMEWETDLSVSTTMNALEKAMVTTVSEELNVQTLQDLLNAPAWLDSTIFVSH